MSVNLFSSLSERQITAAKKYAERGAALLDKYNDGWRDRIALTSLDISSVVECALGQAYGHFNDGIAQLRKSVEDDGQHPGYNFASLNGFDSVWDDDTDENVTHEALAVAWREIIFGRPMTTEEKFAASLNDQVRNIVNARANDEKSIENLREQIRKIEEKISTLETRVQDLNADEENGRALVLRVLNA